MVFRERILVRPPIQGGVTGDIALSTIDSSNLANSAVTTAKINNDAVDSTKISPAATWGASSAKLVNFVPYYNALEVLGVVATSDTNFVGTINGAPNATTVVYNVTSGNEESIVPRRATGVDELGQLRLYNSTRGTYRRITNCNIATNTITTKNSADAWANGDTITCESPTVASPFAYKYFEVDCSDFLPTTCTAILLNFTARDTGVPTGAEAVSLHPYEAYGGGKGVANVVQASSIVNRMQMMVPIISQIFTYYANFTGAGTGQNVFRCSGYWEEAAT